MSTPANMLATLPQGPLFGGKSWYTGNDLNLTAGPTSDWWRRLAMETMKPAAGGGGTAGKIQPTVARGTTAMGYIPQGSPADHGVMVDHGKDAQGFNVNRQLVPIGLGAQQIPGMGIDVRDPRQVPQSSGMDTSSLARPSMAGIGESSMRAPGTNAGSLNTKAGAGESPTGTNGQVQGQGQGPGASNAPGGDPFSQAVMASVLQKAATPLPEELTQEQKNLRMLQVLFGGGGGYR